ncbi:MAG: hypothetical protein MZV63_57605 [Marinilabiliales bacterium]|nr:hypothetical protein [Marinilabiliales bacterium]
MGTASRRVWRGGIGGGRSDEQDSHGMEPPGFGGAGTRNGFEYVRTGTRLSLPGSAEGRLGLRLPGDPASV